jgi:predicted DNA-binding protein (MmcQ/YjbR family)
MTNNGFLAPLQAICLALPEATQQYTFESETFRVRSKIFAMHSVNDGGGAVWVKGRPGDQELLISAAPERFFKPPYLGPKGWIGIRLNSETDWDEVTDLVETSYRLIAPKKLGAHLDRPG